MSEKSLSKVAVLGMGVVHSFGGIPELLRSASGEIPGHQKNIHPINTEELTDILPMRACRRVPYVARVALMAASRALAAAKLHPAQVDLGIACGTAFSSIQTGLDFMDSILDNSPRLSSPTAFSYSVSNMAAGMLSMLLGVRGPTLTVTQFSLSFAGALTSASAMIADERSEYVLVGAFEEHDTRFDHTMAYAGSPQYPEAEGAVFFVLGKQKAGYPTIRVAWNPAPGTVPPLTTAKPVVNIFGNTSLGHAMETCLLLQKHSQPSAGAKNAENPNLPHTVGTQITDPHTGRTVAVLIHY